MKITKKGLILALKNLGIFAGAYQIAGIGADPAKFLFALGIYALISVPSDLYLLNHIETEAVKRGKLGID